MASRFHTLDVTMFGIDCHQIDAPMTPCEVCKPFSLPPSNNKVAPTVTGHGFAMVQRDFKGELVPHVTIPVTPEGCAMLALAILTSGTQCALGIESVHAQGSPLACSIEELVGLNLNCWGITAGGGFSPKLPTGATLSYFPLLTNPTAGDWYQATRTMFVDSLFSTLADRFLRAFVVGEQSLGKRAVEKILKKFVVPERRKEFRERAKEIDQQVDKLLERAVDTRLP